MQWIELTDPVQLEEIRKKSFSKSQVIFKHSTRCSISSMARGRLERATPPPETDFYFLDLIRHRSLSNLVAETFQIAHESPQVILINDGEPVFDESHNGISMEELVSYSK